MRCSVCTSASWDDKNISHVSISAFSVAGATSLLLFSAHSESPREETGRIKGYRGLHRRRCYATQTGSFATDVIRVTHLTQTKKGQEVLDSSESSR